MPLSLTKPAEGTVGWASSINQNWTDLEDYVNSRRMPKGYVTGLRLRYSSATALVVEAGSARDKADAVDVALSSDTTVAITTAGAAGLDQKTSAATISTTASSKAATTSASILSELGITSVSGVTFSSSSTTLTTSSDVRATVSVNDLVGTDSTYGFARVTAINSAGTSLTLSQALPGGNAPAGTALKLIENPTIKAANTGSDVRRVDKINAAGTSLDADSTWGSTSTNVTLTIGVEVASCWYAVWIGSGGSGTTAFLSTQRTTPYTISGYTTNVRRIGWVRNGSAGDVLPFDHTVLGPARLVTFEVQLATQGLRVLSAGGATSWTDVVCSSVAPPSATLIHANSVITGQTAGVSIEFRLRGAGEASTRRGLGIGTAAADPHAARGELLIPCDGAQCIQYALTQSAGTPGYLDVVGYLDPL